jgi:hypothetical protein
MGQSNLYAYANVGRFGLGHSLLAWARACLWSQKVGAQLIAPHWLRFRLGPWLRGERDKRSYFVCFQDGGAISGARRSWILGTTPHFNAENQLETVLRQHARDAVVVFNNDYANNNDLYFNEMLGHHEYLKKCLLGITRPQFHAPVKQSPFLAVHIRMGDFSQVAADAQIMQNQFNVRLPLEWYREKILMVQNTLGMTYQTVVFSDGHDDELSSVLELQGVVRAPRSPAVTDLLTISDASMLIASGSGFSLWGAFLGQVPRICFPGQMLAQTHSNIIQEIELSLGADLPAEFMRLHRHRFAMS